MFFWGVGIPSGNVPPNFLCEECNATSGGYGFILGNELLFLLLPIPTGPSSF